MCFFCALSVLNPIGTYFLKADKSSALMIVCMHWGSLLKVCSVSISWHKGSTASLRFWLVQKTFSIPFTEKIVSFVKWLTYSRCCTRKWSGKWADNLRAYNRDFFFLIKCDISESSIVQYSVITTGIVWCTDWVIRERMLCTYIQEVTFRCLETEGLTLLSHVVTLYKSNHHWISKA